MFIDFNYYRAGLVNVKKLQIDARLQEPEFKRAQGIIFVVGVFGAAGTAVDVVNVETSFKGVHFAVFTVRDPPVEELACLMQAATKVEYNRINLTMLFSTLLGTEALMLKLETCTSLALDI